MLQITELALRAPVRPLLQGTCLFVPDCLRRPQRRKQDHLFRATTGALGPVRALSSSTNRSRLPLPSRHTAGHEYLYQRRDALDE